MNYFCYEVHDLIVLFQDGVNFSEGGLLAEPRQLYEELELTAVSRDVVCYLHQNSLVLPSWDDVRKHSDQFVKSVTFLSEYFCLSKKVLSSFYLSVAACKAVHVSCDLQHVSRSLEDVIVVSDVFVAVEDISGRGQPRPAAVVSVSPGLGRVGVAICSPLLPPARHPIRRPPVHVSVPTDHLTVCHPRLLSSHRRWSSSVVCVVLSLLSLSGGKRITILKHGVKVSSVGSWLSGRRPSK